MVQVTPQKRLTLKNVAYSRGKGLVEYEVFEGNRCVFSGIISRGRSTINSAEEIIRTISEAENRVPLKFYDLQTEKGYDYFSPGEYVFNFLMIQETPAGPEVTDWIEESLPSEILEIFKTQIGPCPRQRQ